MLGGNDGRAEKEVLLREDNLIDQTVRFLVCDYRVETIE